MTRSAIPNPKKWNLEEALPSAVALTVSGLLLTPSLTRATPIPEAEAIAPENQPPSLIIPTQDREYQSPTSNLQPEALTDNPEAEILELITPSENLEIETVNPQPEALLQNQEVGTITPPENLEIETLNPQPEALPENQEVGTITPPENLEIETLNPQLEVLPENQEVGTITPPENFQIETINPQLETLQFETLPTVTPPENPETDELEELEFNAPVTNEIVPLNPTPTKSATESVITEDLAELEFNAPIAPPQVTTEQTPIILPQATEQTPLDITDRVTNDEDLNLYLDHLETNNAELPSGLDDLGQMPAATQFRDVLPTDWAYQALNDLISRYACLVGYPDGTFRGDRPLSRYEFAAALNACIQQVERIIAQSTVDLAVGSDLKIIQRLLQEFELEIANLDTRIDSLGERVGVLEESQFSTTTKLFGQFILGVQGRSENDFESLLTKIPDAGTEINVITNLQLSLFSQFSPNSILFTGLQGGTGNTISGNFNETYTGLGYEGDTDGELVLSNLNYRHLFGGKLAVVVGPLGVNAVNVFRGTNEIESAGYGPLSRFAQRNPIISIGAGSAGLGVDWQIGDRLSLQGVYSTTLANEPLFGGIFGGDEGLTSVGLQLVASPLNKLDVSLQYINSYSPSGRLGTGIGDDLLAIPTINDNNFLRAPIHTDAFGVALDWKLSKGFNAGGWAGYTTSDFKSPAGIVDTWNWMAYLSFPDLLGAGNLGAIYVGMPPKITNTLLPTGRNVPTTFVTTEAKVLAGQLGDRGEHPDSALHLEAFYRWRLTDNVSISPGAIVILNPGHNSANDTIFIGGLRTTFSF